MKHINVKPTTIAAALLLLAAFLAFLAAPKASAQTTGPFITQPRLVVPAKISVINGITLYSVVAADEFEKIGFGYSGDDHFLVYKDQKPYDIRRTILSLSDERSDIAYQDPIQRRFVLNPGQLAEINPLGLTWDGSKLTGHKPIVWAPGDFQLPGREEFEVPIEKGLVTRYDYEKDYGSIRRRTYSSGDLKESTDGLTGYVWYFIPQLLDDGRVEVYILMGSMTRFIPHTGDIPLTIPPEISFKNMQTFEPVDNIFSAGLQHNEQLVIKKVYEAYRNWQLPELDGTDLHNGHAAKAGVSWVISQKQWGATVFTRSNGKTVLDSSLDFAWMYDQNHKVVIPTPAFEGSTVKVDMLTDDGKRADFPIFYLTSLSGGK